MVQPMDKRLISRLPSTPAMVATALIFQGWWMPIHFEQLALAHDKSLGISKDLNRKVTKPKAFLRAKYMQLTVTSNWGPEHSGLRCRATTLTATEQSMPLDISVEMQSFPKGLNSRVKQLNAYLLAGYMELTLTNVETGKSSRVRPYDPTYGMPGFDSGKTTVPLDGTMIEPWQIRFPLVTLGAILEPGQYECRVRFSFPQKRTSWWRGSDAAWNAAGFWHGAVESGPFRIEVMQETPKSKTFLLPKRLRLEKGLKINFTKEDAEPVEFKLRNGHFVSARYYHYDDKKLTGMTMTGVPKPGDVNPIAWWFDYKGGDMNASYKIEIFETADPPVHLWHPGPGSGGFKVLWSKTFTFSLTEKEIRQKQ